MEDTIKLIKEAQNGSIKAKEQLVEENVGLIWSVVRRFSNRGHELDDLYQIGAIGLLKCVEKFDTSFGVRFSTYAVPMIMGEIRRFLRDDGMIKISRPLKEIAGKAKYAEEKFSQKHGRSPTIKELAKIVKIDIEELTLALESSYEVASLHSTIYQSDGNPIFLIDKIDEEESKDVDIVDFIVLREVVKKLKPRERQIINLRYYQDKTQSEIAEIIGISQVQVSRLEKKILESIKENMSQENKH